MLLRSAPYSTISEQNLKANTIVKYLPSSFKANARWRARWTTTLLKKKHCVKVPCLFGQHIENHHQRHGNKKKLSRG